MNIWLSLQQSKGLILFNWLMCNKIVFYYLCYYFFIAFSTSKTLSSCSVFAFDLFDFLLCLPALSGAG